MKSKLLLACCFIFSALFCLGQSTTKQTTKPAMPELKRWLSASGLPFNMQNDSLAVVPYEGANIADYQVLLQKVSDLYIVYTNLSEALPGKLTEAQYKYLLQRNEHFDIVKIGLAEDGVFYLRADIYRSTVTAAILKRIIVQVANVTNIIAGEIKLLQAASN